MNLRTALVLIAVLFVSACTGGEGDQSVAFSGISDGDEVSSPVQVAFESESFQIEPAGDGTVEEGSGHMHVMVDTPCVTAGEVIPSDDTHIHYGDGSTSTELDLTSGEHTLCLQAGDAAHTALDLTDEITVTAS